MRPHIPGPHAIVGGEPGLAASTSSKRRDAPYRQHHGAAGRVEVPKVHVEDIAGWCDESRVLNLGSDLVMHHRLLVLADNIDAEFQMVLGLQLVGLRVSVLGG